MTRVAYLQTGGFAGLKMACDLDTASMAEGEAEALDAKVDAAMAEQAKPAPANPNLRDDQQYEVTVTRGCGHHRAAGRGPPPAAGVRGAGQLPAGARRAAPLTARLARLDQHPHGEAVAHLALERARPGRADRELDGQRLAPQQVAVLGHDRLDLGRPLDGEADAVGDVELGVAPGLLDDPHEVAGQPLALAAPA